jgi:cell division septation protein DedD
MNNERGGIISSFIIIPAAVCLMIGFFFLGYYVGKYQGTQAAQGPSAPPLPEVVSKNLPKPEEFTFYKTLTEKENKTVSIDLRPKNADRAANPEKKATEAPKESALPSAKGKEPESRAEKNASQPELAKQNSTKPSPALEKKTAPAKSAAPSKMRYTIQLSAHQEKQAAEDEVKKLKQNGYAAFIVSSDLPGKGTWYRVRLGSFSKKEAAEKLRKEVHAKVGILPIITVE